MQLTQFTDYSLRILIFLQLNPERLCTVAEIAAAHGVSHDHMRKAAHHLVTLGYIASKKGKGGGLMLAKPADQINIGAVVRQTEPDFHLLECFFKENNLCRLSPSCTLKDVLGKALGAFLRELDQHTLESIVPNKEQLRNLLR